jgi:hypothetical protein
MDWGIGRFSMILHCPREMKRHLCVFIIDRSEKNAKPPFRANLLKITI